MKSKYKLLTQPNPLDFDVLLFTETFLTKLWPIPNFRVFNSFARPGEKKNKKISRPTGGMLIAINNKLDTNTSCCYKTESVLVLNLSQIDLFLVLCYFPPKTPLSDIKIQIADGLSNCNMNMNVALMGDFNCRIDSGNDNRGQELIDFLSEFSLICLNEKDTYTYTVHNGKSTIDLVFLNNISKTTISVETATLTKHQPIAIHLPISKKILPPRKPTIRKIDESLFDDEFRKLQEKIPALNSQDLTLELLKCYEKAKLHRRERISKEWFDSELYLMQKQLKQAYVKSDPQYTIIRKVFKKLCRQKKNFFQKKKEENIINQAESDRTRFWQILKSKENKVNNPQVDANDWIEHFSTLFESEDMNIHPLVGEEHSYALPVTTMYSDYLNAEFTELEIHEEILAASNNKSSGPDGLTYEAFKSTARSITPVLKKLFNDILSNGKIPDTWRSSYLIPLYKGKGTVKDPSNYRGIALQSCLYKIFTGLIYKRLQFWVDVNGKVPREQFGFRRGFSTLTAAKLLKTLYQII